MANSTVICETISSFDSTCYDDEDKFRNAVIVPSSVLAAMDDTAEYGYVRVTPHDSTEFGVLTQIISFSDDHDPEEYSRDGCYMACIRTSLQRRIGLEPQDIESDDGDVKVDIYEYESETKGPLRVHRISAWEQQERDVTTDGFACYVHAADLADLPDLNEGDVAELTNPVTGSRIQLPVEPYEHKHYSRDTIRLNGVIRKLLRVHSVDEGANHEVRLRVLEGGNTPASGRLANVANWVGRRFVDYSYTHLRVLPGYDRDEGRNVVRINEDTMEGLGIEENDRALIRWQDEERNVRCQSGWENDDTLEPKETAESSYGEQESLSIRVPSSERDRLDISVGDNVRIRRDMKYQAGKQVSLSVFGILGVIIGTNRLINTLFDQITPFYVLTTVATLTVLSAVTIWFILKPVRQKCRTP